MEQQPCGMLQHSIRVSVVYLTVGQFAADITNATINNDDHHNIFSENKRQEDRVLSLFTIAITRYHPRFSVNFAQA